MEKVLANEIYELGGQNIEILNRAVSFSGDHEVLYKVNLWSRTALKVLIPFYSFTAHNETVLYKRIRRFNWVEMFDIDQTFAISSTVNSDIFNHSKYVALKVKDAIVDQFRDHYSSRRPSVDVEGADFNFHVHCNMKEFTISLDSSGESLHRRGYRQDGRLAPLNEALAASMVLLSGWDGKKTLYDPMCGSGTILTEAVMIAQNIAPRLSWGRFGFMGWNDYDSDLWHQIHQDALNARQDNPLNIRGSDINREQIKETQELIDRLKFSQYITLDTQDFFQSKAQESEGLIVTNPPYDIRVETDEVDQFYKSIGDTLKQGYDGWDAWILSGNKEALKSLGLRTSRKMTMYNGSIECKYQKYELYRGTKKASKLEDVV
jgi:putative N6-adenine-specific DNA methylase